MELNDKMKIGEKGAWVSIFSYIFLSIIKVSAGYYYHSDALYADGLNNLTDIIASTAVLVGLRISQRPPDQNHRYGHYRAETIAAMVASFIMMSVGVQVLYKSAKTLIVGSNATPELFTAWIALFGAIFMFFVYLYNERLSKKINSHALKAAAMDNRSDALVSVGAFIGIIGSHLGLSWLDPGAAFVVGLIICKTAIDIFRDSTHALTDGFDEKELKSYKKTIQSVIGVRKVMDLKARIHGNNVLLDVTIQVDSKLSVAQSHDISDDIEKRMQLEHQVDHVHIHVEPS